MTPHQWPLRSYLELGALPTAVPCARLHARHLLWEWGLNGLAANTELLVSELVTNAVKATAGPTTKRPSACSCRATTRASSSKSGTPTHSRPHPKISPKTARPTLQEEGGRGLFLVAALSSRWDWYRTREPPGKVVWCELSVEPPEASEGAQSVPQALLSRRIPREQQKQPIEVMRDPDILRRLRMASET